MIDDRDLGDRLKDFSEEQERHELIEVEFFGEHVVEEHHIFISIRELLETVKQVDECLMEVHRILLILVPQIIVDAICALSIVLLSDHLVH